MSVGLPTGKEVTYDYDSLGRFKKRSIATSGHAVTETYSYLKSNYNPNICQNDRTTEFVSTVQYGGYNYSANAFYTYDKRGNISEVVDNGKTYRYQYDGLDRLVREDNQYMNFTKVYEYDANGNIVKITKYDYTTAETLSGGQVTSYSYDTGAHKDRLVKITYSDGRVENFSSYDFLGNPCSYRGIVIEWERGRQMARYRDVQYSYDVSGIRQEKQVGSLLHKYYTDGGRIYKEERGNDTLWYHYDNTGITGIEYNGIAYYFQKNLQGDVVRIYDGNGNLKAQYFYDAWGNHRICDEFGADITEDVITPDMSFTFATHIGRVNPFRYRGYYYDEETNLYYLQSRYYDPETGRLISSADVSSLNPVSINSLNHYAYANNNPIGIVYSSFGVSKSAHSVKAGLLTLGGISDGGSYFLSSNGLSIKFPSQNWLSLGIDFTAGMSGALSVLRWTLKNPEFYKFWYTAYGISKYDMLSNLKSPSTKIASVISYGLVAYDTYTDIMGHIKAGDSWQVTTASGIVTAGVGAFNVWASAKVGAAVGTAIGGAPGFIIGIVAGMVVGIVINGIFYTEINGKSIAGHIEDAIEWFLEWIS